MRRDDLCDFCAGAGRFFYLRCERPAWWRCKPCNGTGTTRQHQPAELRLGRSQQRFLKQIKDT